MQNEVGKKVYSKLLIVLAVLAALLVYLYASSAPAQSRESAEVPVYGAIPVNPGKIAVSDSFVGYVTPIHSVAVVPYINGFLDRILVEGGQEVKAGDTLIVIKQDEYKARLDAAKAQVLQAQANFNNARLYYNRTKKAGARAVSKTELDNAKASYLSAEAALAQAKADRDLAQVNFDYTVIKAPIDGVVGNVSLTKGDYVSPGSQALLKIIQYNPIRVVFSITDKDYLARMGADPSGLFAGNKIKLRLADGNVFAKEGTFRFTGNEIDRPTSSLSVYADFENADRKLLANAYVDVLIERDYDDGILLPQTAISMEAKGNYVFVVSRGVLEKKAVDIISNTGGSYLVKNVFAPGDYVVTDKISRFTPGQKARVRVEGQVRQLQTAEKK